MTTPASGSSEASGPTIRAEEAAATGQLIDFIAARRETFPDMHVYHYNHTERSALERLTAEHGVGEAATCQLVETGLSSTSTRLSNAIQVGTESYGLKDLERLTGYVRGHEIDQGSGAVVEYESFMADHDPERLVASRPITRMMCGRR